MAKTLLNAVNEILKRTSNIAGDAGLLTSLTDSARQVVIDAAVQVVNEGIEELYSASHLPMPNELTDNSITLVAGTRHYSLQSNVVQIRWPLIDRTNGQYIVEYPGGYEEIIINDPEIDDTGLPTMGAIRPVDSVLYLDRAPTAAEAGRIYFYQYDKDISISSSTSEVPFKDAVFRAMVPAWVQLFKRERRNEFDGELFRLSIGRASRLLTQKQMRTHWSPR